MFCQKCMKENDFLEKQWSVEICSVSEKSMKMRVQRGDLLNKRH